MHCQVIWNNWRSILALRTVKHQLWDLPLLPLSRACTVVLLSWAHFATYPNESEQKIHHLHKLWPFSVFGAVAVECVVTGRECKPCDNGSCPPKPSDLAMALSITPASPPMLCISHRPPDPCSWASLQSPHPDSCRKRKNRDEVTWQSHKFYRYLLGRK